MHCNRCHSRSYVLDIHRNKRRHVVTRRRECSGCGFRFTTREIVVLTKPGGRGFTKVSGLSWEENRRKRGNGIDKRSRLD